jgi:hypothetical protein
MTVPVSSERNNYTGDGSTNVYAYGFRISAQTHLLVTVADEDGAETTLTISTDYTVSSVGVKTGGNITLVDNDQDWLDDDGYLDTGWTMSVRHYVPLTQATDIRNQGVYYPEMHEDAFDYLMWAIKQQQDELNRCVKAGETVTGVTPVFPAPEDGKSLIWSGTTGTMVNSDLRGATGATGPQGATGPAGADGADGVDGTDGIFSEIASKAEAEAGVNETKGMNPLRTAQAITALGFKGRPLFFAQGTVAQSVATATVVELTNLDTETYDPDSCFASDKFTPNVAGYYFVIGKVVGTVGAGNLLECRAWFNGALVSIAPGKSDGDATSGAGGEATAADQYIKYFNGTTDYASLAVRHYKGSACDIQGELMGYRIA